jgi:cytoskeleton protein RodZ
MNDLASDSFSGIGQQSQRGPGKRLQEAREARQWTTDYVAGQLRLSRKVIEGLEQDDFRHMPPPAFVRGYLRTYARMMDLSEQEITQAYEAVQGHPEDAGLSSPRVAAQLTSSDRRVRWATYLIVVSVIALPLMWWKTQGSFNFSERGAGTPLLIPGPGPTQGPSSVPTAEVSEPASPQARSPQAPVLPLPALQAPVDRASVHQGSVSQARGPREGTAGPATAGGAEGAAETPAAAADSGVDAEPAPPSQTETGEPQANPLSGSASAAGPEHPVESTPAGAPQADTVVLRFDGESWVQIVDASGQRLMYETGRKGTTKTVQGKAPFKVVLGKPRVVTVEYNGKSLDRNNFRENERGIARFDLGGATE